MEREFYLLFRYDAYMQTCSQSGIQCLQSKIFYSVNLVNGLLKRVGPELPLA